MNYFIYTSRHITPHRRYKLNKLTSLPTCGFIAQLVEHRTGIAEVMGSNPVEALIFFRLLLSNCLNWKTHCDDHSSLSSSSPLPGIRIWPIGFGFTSDWMKKWPESFKPIVWRTKCKTNDFSTLK